MIENDSNLKEVQIKYTLHDGLINVAFFNLYTDKYMGEITINEHDKTVYLSKALKKDILRTDKLESCFYEKSPDKWESIR